MNAELEKYIKDLEFLDHLVEKFGEKHVFDSFAALHKAMMENDKDGSYHKRHEETLRYMDRMEKQWAQEIETEIMEEDLLG